MKSHKLGRWYDITTYQCQKMRQSKNTTFIVQGIGDYKYNQRLIVYDEDLSHQSINNVFEKKQASGRQRKHCSKQA